MKYLFLQRRQEEQQALWKGIWDMQIKDENIPNK